MNEPITMEEAQEQIEFIKNLNISDEHKEIMIKQVLENVQANTEEAEKPKIR